MKGSLQPGPINMSSWWWPLRRWLKPCTRPWTTIYESLASQTSLRWIQRTSSTQVVHSYVGAVETICSCKEQRMGCCLFLVCVHANILVYDCILAWFDETWVKGRKIIFITYIMSYGFSCLPSAFLLGVCFSSGEGSVLWYPNRSQCPRGPDQHHGLPWKDTVRDLDTVLSFSSAFSPFACSGKFGLRLDVI